MLTNCEASIASRMPVEIHAVAWAAEPPTRSRDGIK